MPCSIYSVCALSPFLNDVSVWWHIVGVILIVVGVVVAALVGQQFGGANFAAAVAHAAPLNSAGTLFNANQKYNLTGFPIWYAFLLGLCWRSIPIRATMLGAYDRGDNWRGDASALGRGHVGCRLRLCWLCSADGPVGCCSRYGAAWCGKCINPVLYILETRLGYILGTLLFAVAVGAQFFCGMSSITTNSRMIYAFSRDGAVPFSRLWHKLDSGRTPRNAIILAAVCAFILAIPTVFNFAAYVAITSIAVIGLYISYVLPILLRLIAKDFKPGPWHLGAWSRPIGVIAVVWVIFIAILFMLPTAGLSPH